jgi:hypothetical protein
VTKCWFGGKCHSTFYIKLIQPALKFRRCLHGFEHLQRGKVKNGSEFTSEASDTLAAFGLTMAFTEYSRGVVDRQATQTVSLC